MSGGAGITPTGNICPGQNWVNTDIGSSASRVRGYRPRPGDIAGGTGVGSLAGNRGAGCSAAGVMLAGNYRAGAVNQSPGTGIVALHLAAGGAV